MNEKILTEFATSVVLYCDEQIADILVKRLEQILTAHTTEDESVPKGRLPGETNWQQQQREANTAEDEPKLKPGESIYQANRLSAEQEDK